MKNVTVERCHLARDVRLKYSYLLVADCDNLSDLIVRSRADRKVLQLALSSGISSPILFADYGRVLHRELCFMPNEHFGARFEDAKVAIDHGNEAGQIGLAARWCADWLTGVRGSALFHGIRIISWPTGLARAGLTA